MRVAFYATLASDVASGSGARAPERAPQAARVRAIAEAVRDLHPDVAMLVITDAPETPTHTLGGVDLVRLPRRPAGAGSDETMSEDPRHASAAAALEAFGPDLVVFESHAPRLVVERAAAIGARVVLVQAADADESQVVGPVTAFDRIVLPSDTGEIDLEGAEGLPVSVTGPIVVRSARPRRPPTRPFEIVMWARGATDASAARRFLRLAADAHILARARIPRLSTLLVADESTPVPSDLRGIAGLSCSTSTAGLVSRMARAALVVSPATHDAAVRIRQLEKPAIFVVGRRASSVEVARASALVDSGAAVVARASARSIARRIEALVPSRDALDRMTEAHRARPLILRNHDVATAVLRPLSTGRDVRRVVLVARDPDASAAGGEAPEGAGRAPSGGKGRAERIDPLALATALAGLGVEVVLYATRRFSSLAASVPAKRARAKSRRAGTPPPGVSIRWLYSAGSDAWSDLLTTIDALLVDAPDVVHLWDPAGALAPWVRAVEATCPAVIVRGALAEASALVQRGRAALPNRTSSADFLGPLLDGATPTTNPRAPTLRQTLREVKSGLDLARLARRYADEQRAARATRRAGFAKTIDERGVVHLRALDSGNRLLAEALADCVALGHAPRVEIPLRSFLDEDFQVGALPNIAEAILIHEVPAEDATQIEARIRALPARVFARVTQVRLALSAQARTTHLGGILAVPETHALLDALARQGVSVVPPREIERYLSTAPPEGPWAGMIEPTNICNLGCPTCPTGMGKIKPKPQMSVDRFDSVVRSLVPRLATLALWNYGEPLLHRDLPAIIGKAKAAGVRLVKVSSNAHFLNGERGRALLASGLDELILSVDGASEDTYQVFRKGGSFADVAEQVAWICAEKRRLGLTRPSIELQFIVMRHNEHELDEIRRLAVAWGVDRLRVKTVNAATEKSRHLVPTSKLLSRYREDGSHTASQPFCTQPWDNTVVNVDGAVTPCCYLRPDMGDEFIMGNVFETPFDEIWRGKKYRDFRAAMLAGRQSMPVCDRCRGGTHDLLAVPREDLRPAASP